MLAGMLKAAAVAAAAVTVFGLAGLALVLLAVYGVGPVLFFIFGA